MIPSSMGDPSKIVKLSVSANVMIAIVLAIFILTAIFFFIHLCVNCYRSSHEIVWWHLLTPPHQAQHQGLDPSALVMVPAMTYNTKDFKEGLECAVCLCEVSEGEKLRLLPKCNHGFHLDCIDMWLCSHSTCPLCRSPVICSDENPITNSSNTNNTDVPGSLSDSDSAGHNSHDAANSIEVEVEVSDLPTDVSVSSNETQSNNIGGLVIEIPREICEEEAKSPVLTRLRSLQRMLSRGKRVTTSPTGSSSTNVEQV